MNSRIKTKPTNYNELIELTREDVHTVWLDEKLCIKYVNWMERAIKSTKDPIDYLQYMEYYVEECIDELDNIDTPCYKEDNFGKAGEQPPMTGQTNNLIYEVIPHLTEYLAYLKPAKTSIFALNHYFRLILVLCRRCIELDIECFRLLEIIFGFIRKDASKFRFYDVCGLPKSSGGYLRSRDYEWRPKDYGNGEMSIFLRMNELDKLQKETKDTLDALIAKSIETEEYEEEIEIETEVEVEVEVEVEIETQNENENENENETQANDNENEEKEEDNKETVNETETETETKTETETETETKTETKNSDETEDIETESKIEDIETESKAKVQLQMIKRKVMQRTTKTLLKTRKKGLSEAEAERLKTLRVSLERCSAEMTLMESEGNKIWYIGHHTDYPLSVYMYCGAQGEKARDESWFRMSNINYWGKIGGFATMLKRIAHAQCAVAVSDLVNLIRPVAQLRDLLNRSYFESFVCELRESLKLYYKNLPDLVVRELNKQTVEKSLKNLHYMMNNHYNIECINEAKEKLKLSIAGRQFRAPYAQSRIFGMNDINRYIELSIEKHELNTNKNNRKHGFFGGHAHSAEQKQREQMILNLWLDIKFMCSWIKEEGVLSFILNRKTTHIELIKRLGPIYKLLSYNACIDIGEHIDPLWRLTLHGQHEATRYIVYELICDLAESLNLSETKHLFLLIAKTPKQDYDQQILQLIRLTTIEAFKKQEAFDRVNNNNTATDDEEKTQEDTEEVKEEHKSWFGLDLLWKFVQSADVAVNNISSKTAQCALSIFLELLSFSYAISQRNAYMEKCIWHIQESQKVVQNLQLLQQLIQTFPQTVKTFWGSDTRQKPNTQNGVIERLERDYAIIDHLLQDLAFYKGRVMSISSPHNIQRLRVDSSSFGYLEQIKIRQDFLLFLLTHSGLRLTRAQYRSIWDHLVVGALCREEMDLCFLWLLRGSIAPHRREKKNSHYPLYNQQDQRYLFENCIRTLPAAHLSETGYLLVLSFFCSVNKRGGTLSIRGEKTKEITTLATNTSDDNKKATLGTRQHLSKYIDIDIDNDDSIDPDDHYIDCKRLRVIDYAALDGLHYFWDIVLLAQLPSVGLQAIELLNALHFYFAPRIKSTHRDDIRQQHVKKCLIYLDRALKSDQDSDKNKIVVKRMIMLLKQFLESFVIVSSTSGDTSINIDDAANIIDIEICPDKEFRTKRYIVSMKLSETFGILRKKILRKLSELNSGLIVEHLIIKWNDKYTITMAQHDKCRLSKLDWTQSQILEIKRVRYAFCRYFWMIPQSQQPIADTYSYPSAAVDSTYPSVNLKLLSGFKRVSALCIFSRDEDIYNQLFPLLQVDNIGPAVWDILNLLPPSRFRVRRIIDLGFESKFVAKRWNEIFDLAKPYQLLYYLQILCAVFSGEEWKKEYFSNSNNRMNMRHHARATISHLEWIQRFINLGGFSFITQLLFKIDLNSDNVSLEQKRINVNCVAFLFQIVSMLLSMDKTFKSVIASAKCVTDGSITNFKDFAYIEGKLIQTALNISQKILLWSDLAEKEKEEKENKKEENENKTPLLLAVSEPRGHLKIRRQVSDFSNLANITDLGPNGATILVECLQIMIGCIRTNPKYVTALFEMEHLTQWLTSLLLNTQYPSTRPSVSVALEMLARVDDGDSSSANTSHKLLTELQRIFESRRSQTPDCHEFFELFLNVFDNVCRVSKPNHTDSDSNSNGIWSFILSIASQSFVTLTKYESQEKYAEPENCDEYLVGILNLMRIATHHQLYSEDVVSQMCQYVYYDCLFNVPSDSTHILAKCVSAHSRRIAYALLHKLNSKYPSSLCLVEEFVLRDPVWYDISHDSLQKASWHYHPSDLERFPVRYVGLKNQGATCYMNSLVQQLFIVDDFRRAILSARTTHANRENEHNLLPSSCVLYQIQLLFGYLMKSQKKYYDTMPLCRVLKGFDGEALPMGEQQDVNEFCARLFDQLETNLKLTNNESCIDKAFGGTLINQMISEESAEDGCGHKSEREEAFHTVSLTVKNKQSLRESLALYVAGDILDGDNKWLCSDCDQKRAALKRVCFGELSKYLILHLSRFEFDFNAMRRKKLNTRFEFPLNLNMRAYTKEGLEPDECKDSKYEHPDEYYQYTLSGVVVHTGGAEAGHYYSYAQSSDGQWWEFNDVDVSPFDVCDLDSETFGGRHVVTVDDPQEKGKKVSKECDKPYNAYMLMYKQKAIATESVIVSGSTNVKEESVFEVDAAALTLPAPIQETIWSENLKFLCDKNVFDFDYLTFLWQTVQLASLRRSSDSEELFAIRIATSFVFEILIRAKDNGTFPRWMRMLYKMYQESSIARKWFLNKCATQKLWFINTMFYNAHSAARLAFGDLLCAVIHYQSAQDRMYYDEFISNTAQIETDIEFNDENDICSDESNEYLFWPDLASIAALKQDRFSVCRFIVSCFRLLHFSPKFHRSYVEFFKFLRGIAYCSWHERLLLIKLGVIRCIVAFYLNDTPILHFNRMVIGRSDSGQRQTRRIAPPRCHDLISLLSILVRCASTATYPNANANGNTKEPDLPPEPDDEEDTTEEEEEKEEQAQETQQQPPCIFSSTDRCIALSDEDRACLFGGLDTSISDENGNEWSVPPLIDSTPTYSQYNEFIEHQSALTQYRKKNKEHQILPPNLRIVADRCELRRHIGIVAPRKLARVNVIDHLFRDRSGANNSCSFGEECRQILNYWCFNNAALSECIFDYLYHRVAEEFSYKTSHDYLHYKSQNEYGPYLACVEQLLLNKKDANYEYKVSAFLPKLIVLFKRCSKTDDIGTDLLLFQLSSFFVRIAFKDEFIAKELRRLDDGVLEYCLEEYRVKHGSMTINSATINQSQAYHNQNHNNQHTNTNQHNIKGFNMRRA